MSSKKSKNRKARRSAQTVASPSSAGDAPSDQTKHADIERSPLPDRALSDTTSPEVRQFESTTNSAEPLITGKLAPVGQAPIESVAGAGEPPVSHPKPPVHPATNALLVAPQLVGAQILANIEANQRTTLQAAAALVEARSLPEILALQLRFWIEQCAALGVQSTELIELIGKIYTTSSPTTEPPSSPKR